MKESLEKENASELSGSAASKVGPGRIVGKSRIFYGWWICLGGALIMAMSSGINFHGFSNFIIPLSQEFKWSRTTVSTIFSFARLEAGFIGPLEGMAVDKIGPRKLMLVGIPLMAMGFILLSRSTGIWSFVFIYLFGVTLGNSIGMHTPVSAAVANWFYSKRGMAFGIMWSGVGIGGLIVPLIGWLIAEYDWRVASSIVGVIIVVIGLPVVSVIRHRPEDYGMLPDGRPPFEPDVSTRSSNHPLAYHDFSAKEALMTSSFWFLSLSIMFRSLVSGGVGLHLVPYFVGLGATPVKAATYAGSVGILSIPGRFGLSYLGDYISKRFVMAASLLFMTFAIVLLAKADTISASILGLIIYAVAQGGISVIPQSLIAEYFGRRYFATISGFRSSVQMIGIIVGPIVSGYVFDTTGSYQVAFLGFATATVVAMILAVMATPPRRSVN